MTKAQRADELLCAAKHWQNNLFTAGRMPQETIKPVWDSVPSDGFLDSWASAATSEVCALGFDIAGAEKVTSFKWAGEMRNLDGSKRVVYRAVRR